MPTTLRYFFASILFAMLTILSAQARAETDTAAAALDSTITFQSCAPAVVRVEVRERTSSTRQSHGSGFFVSASGHLITNYHVVSDLVFSDDQPILVVVSQSGAELPAKLLAVDVIHDLALLAVEQPQTLFLSFEEKAPAQGVQLFSLGFPYELGLTIVPGQYNGEVDSAANAHIHFTGAINPGMSGGPVLRSGCRVVGVNVAHREDAEQVGFLVPARYAKALAAGAMDHVPPIEALRVGIRDAIQSFTREQLSGITRETLKTTTLAHYEVPADILPGLECGSDSGADENNRVRYVHHECGSDDSIFVTEAMSAGTTNLSYTVYTATALNRFQFSSFLQSTLSSWGQGETGSRDEYTAYRCSRSRIRHGQTRMFVTSCLREYRKLPGLFELVVATVGLNDDGESLMSFLRFSGIDSSIAPKLTMTLIEGIRWKNRS